MGFSFFSFKLCEEVGIHYNLSEFYKESIRMIDSLNVENIKSVKRIKCINILDVNITMNKIRNKIIKVAVF